MVLLELGLDHGTSRGPCHLSPSGIVCFWNYKTKANRTKVGLGWAELGFCGCVEYRTGFCTLSFCFSASNWFEGSESAHLVQHPLRCAKVVHGPPFAPVLNPSLAIPFFCIILQFCGCFSSDALHPHGSSLPNESTGEKQH